MPDVCHSLCTGIPPDSFRNLRPLLRQKTAVESWCHAHRLKCSFDQKSTAAAERVADNAVRADTGQVNNACRKCLLDRGSVGVLSIATLVQSDAGGVQVEGGNVFADGKLQRMRRTGFREPAGMINRFQPFYSCLLMMD